MINGAAKMLIGQFFTAMEAELKAMPGEEVRQGAAVNFWRYFLKVIREKLAALFGKRREVVGNDSRSTQHARRYVTCSVKYALRYLLIVES
jgi:hypothetical protein